MDGFEAFLAALGRHWAVLWWLTIAVWGCCALLAEGLKRR